jgi:hypothetical protein
MTLTRPRTFQSLGLLNTLDARMRNVEASDREGCGSSSALDLAALEEGRLSEGGIRRLAAHVRRCTTCMAVLVSLVKDSEEADGTGTHAMSTWLPANWTLLPVQPLPSES